MVDGHEFRRIRADEETQLEGCSETKDLAEEIENKLPGPELSEVRPENLASHSPPSNSISVSAIQLSQMGALPTQLYPLAISTQSRLE